MAVDFSDVPKHLNMETIDKWVNDEKPRYMIGTSFQTHKQQLFPLTKPNGELYSGVKAYPISLYLSKSTPKFPRGEARIAFSGWTLSEDVPSASLKKGDVLQLRFATFEKSKTYPNPKGGFITDPNILSDITRNPYEDFSPMYDWRLVDFINAQDVMRNIEHISLLLFEGLGVINKDYFYDETYYNALFEGFSERPFFINFFLKEDGKAWSSSRDSFANIPTTTYGITDRDKLSISYDPPIDEAALYK